MKRTTLLAAIAVTTAAVGGAALADANHGHGGQADVTQVSGPMQNSGPGMMGMMGGMGPMGGSMMQTFDSDGDGTVTAEEMHARLQAQLAEYDSDGDGALSIAEFETLHSAMIREMMVDRFQHLDADGDGSVTSEEMAAPAVMMERAQMMRNRMMAAQPEMGADMSDGNMMNDN
jgi:Ca2+-binding EF-hand superfamily protein